jgi:hypothetical protein
MDRSLDGGVCRLPQRQAFRNAARDHWGNHVANATSIAIAKTLATRQAELFVKSEALGSLGSEISSIGKYIGIGGLCWRFGPIFLWPMGG